MEPNIVDFPGKATIEDEAWAWIIKFEGDSPPSKEDIAALKAWMARSPAHKQTLERIARGWYGLDILKALVIPLENRRGKPHRLTSVLLWLVSPVLVLISLFGYRAEEGVRIMPLRSALTSLILLVGLMGVGWYYQQSQGIHTYATEVGESAGHRLADDSMLWLNTNSRASVEYTPQARRITLHQGEAYFEVQRDAARAFEVYAGNRMVRAVGTAFSVHLKDRSVEVMVSEGKVELAAMTLPNAARKRHTQAPDIPPDQASSEKPMPTASKALDKPALEVMGTLIAGQSVVLEEDDASRAAPVAQHKIAELQRRLAWRDGQLIYAGESLAEVIDEISRYTPVYIELVDPELAGIRIGGQFQIGKTEALFDVLELGFGLQVSRLNEHHVQIRAKE